MSIPILYELQEETKRLTIAGSDLAIGDAKLKKIIPVLKKMGEKSPIFSRLAAVTEQLADGIGTSAEHLLELSYLVTSILYTQGTTGKTGEWEVDEPSSADYPTDLPHRSIRPLFEALTTKGSGRLQVIEEAYQAGNCTDLRLVFPLLQALDDSYSDIADFVAEKMLPAFGASIVPHLTTSFTVNGTKGDARKLLVMSHFLQEKGLPLYMDAVKNGSLPVRVAAISALHAFDEAEEILLEQARDKKSDIRQAAYASLAKRESEAAAQCLIQAFSGKDHDLVAYILGQSSSYVLAKHLLPYAKETYRAYLQDPNEAGEKQILALLPCFHSKQSPEVFTFLQEVIESSSVSVEVIREAATVLLGWGDKASLSVIESVLSHPRLSRLADLSLVASLSCRSKEEIFEMYSRYVKRSRKDPAGNALLEMMDRLVFFDPAFRPWDEKYRRYHYGYYYYSELYSLENYTDIEWDQRWVSLLMALDEEQLVFRIARNEYNEQHIDYLLDKLSLNPYFSSKRGVGVLTSLLQIGYERVYEALIETLKKTDVNMHSVKYHVQYILDSIGLFECLPSTYAEQIETIAREDIQHERLQGRMLEIAHEMKKRNGER